MKIFVCSILFCISMLACLPNLHARPKLFVGTEQEFAVPPDKNAPAVLSAMKRRPSFACARPKGYLELDREKIWSPSGSSWYQDGYSGLLVESNSPLVQIRKGFAKQLVSAMLYERAELVKTAGGGELRSTHFNVGAKHIPTVGRLSMNVFSPLFKVLLRTNMKRIKEQKWDASGGRGSLGRLEFRAYGGLDPDQTEAALVVLVGIVQGLDRLASEHLKTSGNKVQSHDELARALTAKLPIVPTKPAYKEFPEGGYVAWTPILSEEDEIKIFKGGLDAKMRTNVGTITLRDFMKTYIKFFEHDIEKVATAREIALLQKYVSGAKSIENPMARGFVDKTYLKTVSNNRSGVINPPRLSGPSRLFADAAISEPKRLGDGLSRQTTYIGWDKIGFSLNVAEPLRKEAGLSSNTIRLTVPVAQMEKYLKQEPLAFSNPELFAKKVQRWLSKDQ